MLNYRRVIRVGGGSLFKPDNAASYKNYPLSLRLFYENAAIKVTAYYPLYELQNSLYSSISKQEPSLTMHLLPDCRVLFLNTHKVMICSLLFNNSLTRVSFLQNTKYIF